MKRRDAVLALIALGGAPFASIAQQQGKVWRVGILLGGAPTTSRYQLDAFAQGLKEHGFTEGRNVLLETRWAEGRIDRFPVLAAELLERKVDVLFAPSGVAAQAAQKTGTTTPIVFALAPDPVAQGFGKSLSHPGGNMTGLTSTHGELSAKRLELLKEAFPKSKRIAVLYFVAPSAAGVPEQLAETARAAKALGVELVTEQSPRPEDFARAFASLRKLRPDALVVIENPMFFANRARLAELALELRVPAIYNVAEYAEAGGLMSYGASYADLIRRAAAHVARILEGAKPGDLPIEQPTKFELVLNLKNAKAMGIAIPQNLLLRADRVIE